MTETERLIIEPQVMKFKAHFLFIQVLATIPVNCKKESTKSARLFSTDSQLNGSVRFRHDTLSFLISQNDQWDVYEEDITGIKVKR